MSAQKFRPRRDKMFGEGRLLPLDRNAKARIMVLARALMRRTEKGKHYGVVTAKFVAVLEALLWGFHKVRTSDWNRRPRIFSLGAAPARRCDSVASSAKAMGKDANGRSGA